MSAQLDPWRDASLLAARLQAPDSVMVVAVGAEQWCARCRALRPGFDRHAAAAAESEVWLWLDIEDHAEFLGDYFPENLPVLFAYRGPVLAVARTVEDVDAALHDLAALGMIDMCRAAPCDTADPGIRDRLLLADWAL